MNNRDALAQGEHSRDSEHNHGHEHEHRYEIIVNGQPKVVHTREVSFEEAIALAYNPVPSGPTVAFTVTYRHAAHNRQGSLTRGQSVEIKNGTVFDVDCTDKS